MLRKDRTAAGRYYVAKATRRRRIYIDVTEKRMGSGGLNLAKARAHPKRCGFTAQKEENDYD